MRCADAEGFEGFEPLQDDPEDVVVGLELEGGGVLAVEEGDYVGEVVGGEGAVGRGAGEGRGGGGEEGAEDGASPVDASGVGACFGGEKGGLEGGEGGG